jgi:hypothetical protein
MGAGEVFMEITKKKQLPGFGFFQRGELVDELAQPNHILFGKPPQLAFRIIATTS